MHDITMEICTINYHRGTSGQTGISVSATFHAVNIILRPGVPSLSVAPAFKFAIGRSV